MLAAAIAVVATLVAVLIARSPTKTRWFGVLPMLAIPSRAAPSCTDLAEQPLLQANGYRPIDDVETGVPHDVPVPPGSPARTCNGALMSVFVPLTTLVYPGASRAGYLRQLRAGGWQLVQRATALTPDEYGSPGVGFRISALTWRGTLLVLLSESD